MANKSSFQRHRLVKTTLERELVFKGVPINVEFDFYEGHEGGPDEPPDYDYIELLRVVTPDEYDILHLMGSKTVEELLDVLHGEVDKLKESV